MAARRRRVGAVQRRAADREVLEFLADGKTWSRATILAACDGAAAALPRLLRRGKIVRPSRGQFRLAEKSRRKAAIPTPRPKAKAVPTPKTVAPEPGRILGVLPLDGPAAESSLAAATGIHPAYVRDHVQSLERDGLVACFGIPPERFVRLTPAGRQAGGYVRRKRKVAKADPFRGESRTATLLLVSRLGAARAADIALLTGTAPEACAASLRRYMSEDYVFPVAGRRGVYELTLKGQRAVALLDPHFPRPTAAELRRRLRREVAENARKTPKRRNGRRPDESFSLRPLSPASARGLLERLFTALLDAVPAERLSEILSRIGVGAPRAATPKACSAPVARRRDAATAPRQTSARIAPAAPSAPVLPKLRSFLTPRVAAPRPNQVEFGDRVRFVYADEPETERTVILSRTRHAPDEGIVGAGRPLTLALLGLAPGGEASFVTAGRERTLRLLALEKGAEKADPEMLEKRA